MSKITQYSAINIILEADVDAEKWSRLPSDEEVINTITAIQRRGITVIHAKNGQDALDILKTLIPQGAEVMDGASVTLFEIGYREFVDNGQSGWKSLRAAVHAESDDAKRHELRRKSMTAQYFVSGINAITQSGELVACDTGGSRVGAWHFAAGHLILVCGINKIVPTLDDAMRRVREYTYPLENIRASRKYGESSQLGKWVILAYEKKEGRVTLVLIDELLGY
jgi:L-lactate utilization protein LutB